MFQTGKPNLEKLPRMMDTLESLENSMKFFGQKNKYLAGDSLSLADLSIYYTLSLMDAIESHVDWSKTPKLKEFVKNIDAELKKYDTDGKLQKAREDVKGFAIAAAFKANQ